MLPREKTLKYGINYLTNEELLALVIKTGPKGSNVFKLVEEIIEKANGFKNLLTLTYEELTSIKGIGKAKSLELLAILEIARRLSSMDTISERQLDTPDKIADWLRFEIAFSSQEEFVVIFLANSGKIIKHEILFKGSKNCSVVSPDEILVLCLNSYKKQAILYKAAAIVVCHNHPSDRVEPSQADLQLTSNLKRACSVMSIPLLDHIIVGKDSYYSFRENGVL